MHLRSRGFGVQMTHWTGLCILEPENVSPSCRDIIVSMLSEITFYFQLLCMCVLTFWGKKIGSMGPPVPPHAKARIKLITQKKSAYMYWQINTSGLFSYTHLIQVPQCTVTLSGPGSKLTCNFALP